MKRRLQPGFVVRSLGPAKTSAAVRAADEARADARRAVLGLVDELFPQGGWLARTFDHFDGSFQITGFVLEVGQTSREEVPPGMRYDKKSRSLVPAVRTDEGKALYDRLKSASYSYPYIDGLGGIVSTTDSPPGTPSHLRRGYFTGWHFEVIEGAAGGAPVEVFALLGQPYLDERPAQAVIDAGDRWEVVPLSTYHLAVEAADARVTQAPTTRERP